jgi:hypothetical protein
MNHKVTGTVEFYVDAPDQDAAITLATNNLELLVLQRDADVWAVKTSRTTFTATALTDSGDPVAVMDQVFGGQDG